MTQVPFGKRALDAAVLLLLIGGGGGVFLLSERMPVAARTFPRMMATAMLAFCALALFNNLVRGVLADSDYSESPDTLPPKPMSAVLPRLVAFVLATVGFIVLMPVLGFEGAGAFLILAGMLILDVRQALRSWWVALILPPLLGYIFREGLYLRLPLPPFLS